MLKCNSKIDSEWVNTNKYLITRYYICLINVTQSFEKQFHLLFVLKAMPTLRLIHLASTLIFSKKLIFISGYIYMIYCVSGLGMSIFPNFWVFNK